MRRNAGTSTRVVIACILALGLLVTVGVGPVHACDFDAPPPPERALEDATAVFAGEVEAIEPAPDDPTGDFLAVTFTVDRAWKGVETSPVTVETHRDEATCGYPFEEGERYLVYAYGGEDELFTALFHRTARLENANADLDVLGEGDEIDEATAAEDGEGLDGPANPVIIGALLILVSIGTAVVIVLRRARAAGADEELD